MTGPSLRLIPATPVDPKLTMTNDADQAVSNSTSVLSNTSMSRTPSAKSRRSSKSSSKAERKPSKGSKSLNLGKYSFRSIGSSDKECSDEKSPLKSSNKKSIRLIKKKSMKSDCEESLQKSISEGNVRKLTSKNSFYRMLDKIRGVSSRRDSSAQSGDSPGASGGQTEFLSSISRMSDSRIVENWLLSIEDEQLMSEPPPLESLTIPETRVDQKTPTNEEVDVSKKATVTIEDGGKHMFEISSDDSSDVMIKEPVEDRRRSMFRPGQYGRQVSESSEYTTDTHDTGEIAHVTAMNTLRNTSNIFTSVGEELKKVTLSPGGSGNSGAVFRPISSCGQELESTRSSETLGTTVSSVRYCAEVRDESCSGASDCSEMQGSLTSTCTKT